LLCHTNDLGIFPDVGNERVLGSLELLHNVLIERVHVFHQPFGGGVVDSSGVMENREIGFPAEVSFEEFGVSIVRRH
jgi:hypothetical protein